MFSTYIFIIVVENDIDEDVPLNVHPDWEGRLNFTWPDANITFYSLELEDEGRYQCYGRINTITGPKALTDVHVYGKLIGSKMYLSLMLLWYYVMNAIQQH